MSNSLIAEIPVKDFNFTGFIESIEDALGEKIEPYYVAWYLRESESDDNIYLELDEEEVESIKSQDITYEEDLLNNDRIMFVRFVLDGQIWEEKEYLCGDGTFIDYKNYDSIKYGEFKYDENGFLIKSKNGILTFEKATLGLMGMYQEVVRTVEDAGDFNKMMVDFVNKYNK